MDYMEGLDGIRALAVTPVVLLHLGTSFSDDFRQFVAGGFLGVDLFFVLSAFLITLLLTREQEVTGTISFRKFYARRGLRLLPALLVLLFMHAIYARFSGLDWDLEVSSLLSILFYYSNYKITASFEFADGLVHLWSLAVEEQFYFVWPLFLLLCRPLLKRPGKLLFVLFWAIACVMLWRSWLYWNRPGEFYYMTLYMRTDTRIDSLLVGAVFALWPFSKEFQQKWLPWVGLVSLVFIVWCMKYVPSKEPMLYWGGFTVIAIAAGFVILAVARTRAFWTAPFHSAVVRGIGKRAYGIYIWHLPIFYLMAKYTEGMLWYMQAFIGVAIVAAVVMLSWRFVEQPCLRLKSRFSS